MQYLPLMVFVIMCCAVLDTAIYFWLVVYSISHSRETKNAIRRINDVFRDPEPNDDDSEAWKRGRPDDD